MLPYLFHCGAPPHSKRGMGEINQCHYWLSSPTITGQTAVSPIRLSRPQQGSTTLHRSNHTVSHTSRTGWASLYRVGTVASPLTRGRSPVTHVKSCVPLETIKGEPGLTSKTRPTIHTIKATKTQHTHNTKTPSEFTHRVASHALSTTQSRDLRLSPLSQPLVYPYYKHSRVQGNTDP